MSKKLVDVLKRHFNLSIDMLDKVIDYCPDEIWLQRKSRYILWHQIYHACHFIDYWFRDEYKSGTFKSMIFSKDVSYDLDLETNDFLTKTELKEYLSLIRKKTVSFFDRLDDNMLSEQLMENRDFTYCDAVLCQIRHIQYHVGHCNSIFRENNYKSVEWHGYYGR